MNNMIIQELGTEVTIRQGAKNQNTVVKHALKIKPSISSIK